MKKTSSPKSSRTLNPGMLELVFEFDAVWPHQPNGLFRLVGTDRLFLAKSADDGEVIRGPMGLPVLTKDAHPGNFREVTLKESIEWLALCDTWTDCSTGSLLPLLEIAAKQLKGGRMKKALQNKTITCEVLAKRAKHWSAAERLEFARIYRDWAEQLERSVKGEPCKVVSESPRFEWN